MRWSSLVKQVLGVERAVLEGFRVEDDHVVVEVRLRARDARRAGCGRCGRRGPRYDRGNGRRQWRALDLCSTRVYLEAEAPRVCCPVHGPTVIRLPWARHDTGFTRAFEDSAAWLVTQMSKTAVSEFLRIAWRTVGNIVMRVVAEREAQQPKLKGLRRIGIDEFSYRKHHRYLTVVVDHETGRLVWAAPGFNKATLNAFFDQLGPEGCAQIEWVSADAASVIRTVVQDRCPNAKLCLDPFHLVAWATDALDEVRREHWRQARELGLTDDARHIKGARFALWKNPEKLTHRQHFKLALIARFNRPLYRAYLLKEQFRQLLKMPFEAAQPVLDSWLKWAQRCRLRPFVELGRRIRRHRAGIDETLRWRLSNGLVESLNTKLRLVQRRAFGFKSPYPLIALAKLALGGLCPPLPGRSLPT